jgi:uncharacterized cupin superfamily protein
MPKIDIDAIPRQLGGGHSGPFSPVSAGRIRQRLGDAGGLVDFDINLTQLPPGDWSGQRFWLSREDQCLYMLEGELLLVEKSGETMLRAGDFVAFRKGERRSYHMINRSDRMAVYLDIASRQPADVTAPSDADI